jgi:Kef-type K+ transport system membrane component KefB
LAAARNQPLVYGLIALFTALPALVGGQPHEATGAHADPIAPVVLALAIILTATKLGGRLAGRFFLGATLTATSVGITARVLQDLHRSQSPEARVILGAAVIDDVLGLFILAVVAGAIGAADHGGSLSYAEFGLTLGKAVVFLFGALVLGVYLSPRVFSMASRVSGQGVLVIVTTMATPPLLKWSLARRR